MDLVRGWVTVVPLLPPPMGLVPVGPAAFYPSPKPRQLRGWKEITGASSALGGPSNEQHLREIAQRDPFCPIYVPYDGGMVTALEPELAQWLKLRRKPLGMRRLSDQVRKKRPAKKRAA